MDNEISKAIKRKTDAQMRMNATDITPVVNEGVGNTTIINDPSKYIVPMVAGQNVTIGTSGSNKVINALMNILAGDNITVTEPDENGAVTISGNIGGKPIDLTGLADGYALTYDALSDSFILAEMTGSITQATETELGGVKAKEKTTESTEVAIDPLTGKLYVPESSGSYTLPQATELELGGIKAKARTTEDAEVAIDETTGKLYAPESGGSYTLPQATETTLGGVKAKAKTTEVGEIAIDPDGRLFSPALPPTFYSDGVYATEDFEDLEFIAPYTTSAWSITTADKKTGQRSIVSSTQYSANHEIRFTLNVGFPGLLSFWYKANKENTSYAKYTFKLDGVTLINAAAAVPWTYFECPITAGQHELYVRGSDHVAWWSQVFIDDISFPGSRQYFHGIEDHSEMPNIFDNQGKLLKASDDGSTLEFVPQDTFIKTPETEGTAGQVLMTDGAGGRSWGDIVHPPPMVGTGTELPTADISYRSQIFTVLGGVGVADTSYVCQKDATDAYVWTPI